MSKITTFLLAFCCLFAASSFAQNTGTKTIKVDQLKSFKIDQAGIYRDFTTGENQYDSIALSLSNSELVPLEGSFPKGARVDTGLPRILKVSYGVAKKKMLVAYEIPVFYKHDGANFLLKSFDLQSSVSYHAPRTAARTFAPNSVLANGTWYKIAVDKRGVFKMDYAFLQSLGVNPATINPANIRVFGNGGTVMNEAVSDGTPDDLVENAVEVKASGTTFGTSDYVLFYANGPVKWEPMGDGVNFTHTQNYYEDKSFYFVSFDNGVGKRIGSPAEITASPSVTITDFDAYAVIDKDSVNLSTMGKMWFSNKTYRSVASNIPVSLRAISGSVRLDFQIAGATDAGSLPFFINYGSNTLASGSFSPIDINSRAFFTKNDSKTFTPASSSFSLELKNNSTTINGILYLDYFRFNFKSPLSLSSTSSLNFRSYQQATAAAGTVTAFKLTNGNSNVKIWDVTNPLNPQNISFQLNGNQITMSDSSALLKEYVAFENTAASTPLFVSTVENQNLHALAPAQYLIITDKALEPAANKLADFHRTKFGTTVRVVTVDKIYNEFSSGGQDIGGIRNFIKMFYDRGSGTNQLKNVLLLGAASYDYKNRVPNNTNIVPVYETYASNSGDGAYSTDEFYTLLDEGESILQNNGGAYIDVGIGRIPTRTLADAMAYVDKAEMYASNKSFGEWKLNTTFVADDYESSFNFLSSIEQMSSTVKQANWLLMESKLYTDAAPRIATVGGVKFPSVTQGINNQIANGTLLMNYIGHGSPERWAVEEILYGGDVDKWSNSKKLPIIITATCDFGRFDDPADTAVGVSMVTKANGGAIATLTTTQSVYEDQNNLLNTAYLETQFAKQADGSYKTLGEAFADAKNYINTLSLGYQTNSRKFVVLGDPALKPSLPENNVYADSIFERRDNGELASTDTLKSLGKYVLKGHVADKTGNSRPDFNGQVYVTLLDKMKKVSATNPNLLADTTKQSTYNLQNNILFKGNTKVENGEFSINLILPKDINYDFGNGKLMLYAFSETEDAAGADTSFSVGGFSSFAGVDNQGPIVKPFIDDSRFRSGDIVSETPQLYVELADDNGINVSGSSIGHDLIAIVDGAYDDPYVLNSYYQTASDDYTKGNLYYQLGRLEPGKHTLTVRAWDVYNNSGEGSIDFWVKGMDTLDFNLYNFPNPFNSTTSIVFQHNQPNVDMEVTLKIFSTNGTLVYDNQKNIRPTESFTTWQWNGSNAEGATVGNGVYLYQVSIKTSKQLSKTLYNKLIFAR